jgi:hypothetical protein
MYKLTAKTIEYKPGDSIMRKHEAWNFDGGYPQKLAQMIDALVRVNLLPPSIADEIPDGVLSTVDEIMADRIAEFYGVDDLTLKVSTGKDKAMLTVEIPPFVSFYTFEVAEDESQRLQRLDELNAAWPGRG